MTDIVIGIPTGGLDLLSLPWRMEWLEYEGRRSLVSCVRYMTVDGELHTVAVPVSLPDGRLAVMVSTPC